MTATIAAASTTRNAADSKSKRLGRQQVSHRAAIYVRISLDSTGEGLGVARQEEDARAIIEQRGWTLAGVYSDNSISASDSRKHRPRYADMQRDYAEGLFDALVVWDLDRLTRQPRQLEDWIDAAEGRGLALVTTNGEADLTTDGGRMYARIKLAVARAEIERKSARHKRALQQHAKAGKVPHGPRLFGYTAGGNIEPKESVIVTDVFERFYAGESLRSLARMLEDKKVPTRSGRPWNTRTVRDMLTNARYAGWAVYQGEIATDNDGNLVRGKWEPLIGEDTFDVIQARLSDPSRKTNRVGTDRRYLGSSLYLCAECDGLIKTVNGGKYFCSGHVIREHRHVDQFVIDVIAERLSRKDFEKLLAPVGNDMKPVVEQSKQLRARLAKIDNEYDEGIIDGRRWRSAKEKVQAKLREIDKKLATRKGGAALGKIAEAPDPAQAFREASLMGQRAVIDALCTVRLRRAGKGRLKRDLSGREVIDPASVVIDWRR
ncbi:recombinase family protein [Mycobacterium sp.]|uniref:recombinase family protein n=1 Tax=Mycobacterium sp. TaxID=1785 RepID=UPI003F9A6A6F